MTHIHWIELFVYVLPVLLFLGFLPYLFYEERRITKHIYGKLCLPSWAPPIWAFSMVWLIVYLIEAIAYTIVRLRGEWTGTHLMWGLVLFWILQFFLMLWTVTFRRSLGWSFLICVIGLALAGVVTWLFWFVNDVAGIMMLVVALWLLFATILAAVVWWMNWNCDVPNLCRAYFKITPC
jgi:translocator protein